MITQEDIKKAFDYDPNSGFLIRRSTGRICNSVKGRYYFVNAFGTWHPAHRVIWMWLYGYWPLNVDHIDRNGFNNKQENMREATVAENLANVEYSPMRGIEKHGRKYRVRIGARENRVTIGLFDTIEEAREAHRKAAIAKYGDFAIQ